MWIFCYLLIFVIYPIYSPIKYSHESLIDFLSFMGIIFFAIGQIFGEKIKFTLQSVSKKEIREKFLFPSFKISLFFFIIFFLISIYFLIKILGLSGIILVLKGAITSKSMYLGNINSNPITFSMHLLVPCVLCMWISAKNKYQKIISIIGLIIYIIETILFGFTRIFLITILAIIFFYEVRNMKAKKQAILVLLGLMSAIILLVFMNYIRCLGISSAASFSDYVNIDYIFESTDFGASYLWFNRLLDYDDIFINPIVYLKPFYAFIPRSIWNGKPEPMSLQILKIIDPALAATGYSTAGNSVLGEGFAILGLRYVGIFLNCFIWGFICKKLDIRYKQRIEKGMDSSLLNIYYYIFSVFIVISGQRGDWSQYMTIVIWFYFLPIYFFSILHAKLSSKEKQ